MTTALAAMRHAALLCSNIFRICCSDPADKQGNLGTRIMKIGIHARKPPVVVSLLLAILALFGYFVDSSFAFLIAMFAYIVGALGVLVEI